MSDVSFLGKVGWREDTVLSWPAFLSVMQRDEGRTCMGRKAWIGFESIAHITLQMIKDIKIFLEFHVDIILIFYKIWIFLNENVSL